MLYTGAKTKFLRLVWGKLAGSLQNLCHMIRLYNVLLAILLLSTTCLSHAAEVKNSDLAGSWYPASKTQLEDQLKSYLDAAKPEKIDGKIIVVIVPHAGYAYSGPVAAYGYKAVEGKG